MADDSSDMDDSAVTPSLSAMARRKLEWRPVGERTELEQKAVQLQQQAVRGEATRLGLG